MNYFVFVALFKVISHSVAAELAIFWLTKCFQRYRAHGVIVIMTPF